MMNAGTKHAGTPLPGEVPIKWEVKRLKRGVVLRNDRIEVNDDSSLPYIGMEHIESWTGRLLPLDEEFVPTGISNRFKPGQVLFGKLRPYLAKAIVADRAGICSTELMVLEPDQFDPYFLLYLLLSDGFIKLVDSSTQGSKMPRADWDFIGNIEVAYPPLPTQRAITSFLDQRTARIDGLVQRMQQLVQRLKEKRQALIARAVTRGLDPKVKLKDSGVPWLGKVPEHWEVLPIRRCASEVQTGSTPPTTIEEYYQEGTIDWYGPSSFGEGLEIGKPVKTINTKAVQDKVVRLTHSDSVGLVGIGATLGKVAYLPRHVATNQQVTTIIFDRSKLDCRFMAYQMKSFENVFRGIAPSVTLAILNQQEIAAFKITIPSMTEQVEIVKHLDRQCALIDSSISKASEMMERLQEYRVALISAAVTGRLKVD